MREFSRAAGDNPQFSEVPKELRSFIGAICTELPEAELVDNGVGFVLRIRRRSFGLLAAVDSPDTSTRHALLVLLADPDERQSMLAVGHPYFPVPTAGSRIGILLDDATDRTEVSELVIEAYRQVAPKGLVAQLPEPAA